MDATPIIETYARLALAIDRHQPGYLDAYHGPAEWQQQAAAGAPRPLAELAREVEALAAAVAQSDMDASRRDFLTAQVRAMQVSLRLLAGEPVPFVEEVEALYGITPAWTDEARFDEAHRVLADLLPPGGSLAERRDTWRKQLEVSVEQAGAVFPAIFERLRGLTRARFPLPPAEDFEMAFVKDRPWSAYNWYQGGYRSRIEINTDLPLRATALVGLIAHEGYPGHHTEAVIKEARLVVANGWIEHSLAIINSPQCTIAEGIATRALDVLLTDDEQIAWHAEELFPRLGLAHVDARRVQAILHASEQLGGVGGNAAFLMHARGASADEIVAYLQRYSLARENEARKSLDFLTNPLSRTYTFTYHVGGELLDELFAARGERERWFTRLLSEPVTPAQVHAWAGEQVRG
jgi:hypothetical protein